MQRSARYVTVLVAVLLVATAAFVGIPTLKAQGRPPELPDNAAIKEVLCQTIQGMDGNPKSVAIALCGDLLFKTVFVTSQAYTGDLESAGPGATGLEGGDRICNDLAQEAGLAGTYTAWLSDSTADARDRVTQSAVPYRKVGGLIVADSFGDLTDCTNPTCLQGPINRDEKGRLLLAAHAWTGTDPGGISLPPANCGEWTSANTAGLAGASPTSDSSWTTESQFICSALLRLYCFQN